jgi:hypothetical protein
MVKSLTIGLTLLAFVSIHCPGILWAQSATKKVNAAGGITDHDPQVRTTAERKRPMSTGAKILLGVIGAALIAGAVALGSGDSGGGDDGTEPEKEVEPGGVTVGW